MATMSKRCTDPPQRNDRYSTQSISKCQKRKEENYSLVTSGPDVPGHRKEALVSGRGRSILTLRAVSTHLAPPRDRLAQMSKV